jgi:hypothetical protein
MTRILFALPVLLLMAGVSVSLSAGEDKKGDDKEKAEIKKLEEGVGADIAKAMLGCADRAMEAYNKEDAKAFFAEWASQTKPAQTENMFKTSYVEGYKKKFNGALKSKKLIADERSKYDKTAPVLIYEGEFEKRKTKIVLAYMKDGDTFKLMQVTFD